MKHLISVGALALMLSTPVYASEESKTWDASDEAKQFVLRSTATMEM